MGYGQIGRYIVRLRRSADFTQEVVHRFEI
jgi:hypothetical protein